MWVNRMGRALCAAGVLWVISGCAPGGSAGVDEETAAGTSGQMVAGKGGGARAGQGGGAGVPSGGADAAAGASAWIDAAGSVNDAAAPPEPPASAKVVISEIMYHPVKEEADEDFHEFIELFGRAETDVDIGGWSLESSGKNGVKITFAAGTKIAAGEHKVVAKSRAKLATVAGYGLSVDKLLGDYTGQLDNGGTTVSLKDAAGQLVDVVKYGDSLPWPAAADALGVSEDWLPAADRPITKHQYKGRSLERIDVRGPSTSPSSWEASALDGATPGKANSVAGAIKPVVLELGASPEGRAAERVIRKEDKIVVKARFSDVGTIADVKITFFDDDVTKTGEATTSLPMTLEGGVWQVTLPARADHTLTRYQLFGKRNGGAEERVSPRPTDPFTHHAFFVTPKVDSPSRAYHLLIAPSEWSKLETWVAQGLTPQNDTCTASPNWDDTVPATFVFDGHVYDVRVRYGGGGFNRPKGLEIPGTWAYPKPTFPADRKLQVLTWKVKFPKYDSFDGKSSINLNKLLQGCPGSISYVESKLLQQAGLPSYDVGFARLHINGGYYAYTAELENIGDEMLERFLKEGEIVGDLFKADGYDPQFSFRGASRGDFKPITAPASFCGGKFTALRRYELTYSRENWDHRGHAELIKLIDDLEAAVKSGLVSKAVQDYFNTYWDVELMAKSFAIRNWAGAWDDTMHNYFPYKQPNGKWIIIQQDFDWEMGIGAFGDQRNFSPWRPDESLYIGAYQGEPIASSCEVTLTDAEKAEGRSCNSLGFSRLKDAFIRNFRQKYDATMKDLSKTVLATDAVTKLIDEAAGRFNLNDWNQSPANKGYCKPAAFHDAMRTWAKRRNETVRAKLGE